MTPFEQWWLQSGECARFQAGEEAAYSETKRVAHAAWIAALQHVRDAVLDEQTEFPNE